MAWKNYPVVRRAQLALVIGIASLFFPGTSSVAALPDYKLGEVATDDVVTPVPLVVVNPVATEALKQKVAQQVLFVVRHNGSAASEAEADLRRTIAAVRHDFLLAVENVLQGRSFAEAAVDSPVFVRAMGVVAGQAPKELPLYELARLWIRGASDESLVESLVRPLHEVMILPVVKDWSDGTLPNNEPVRLLSVASLDEPPTTQELDMPEQVIQAVKIISLAQARILVGMRFPAGQEERGKFVASFLRANAAGDLSLTEILRAKKIEGVTVNDNYGAGQLVLRKGRMVDRQALGALAAMREQSVIGVFQNKLDQDRSAFGEIGQLAKWLAVSLGVIGFALALIFWRLRGRPATTLVPTASAPALMGWEPPVLTAGREPGSEWQRRAIEAEHKAERAHAAIRSGVMAWMKDRLFRTLTHQRSNLLSVQQRAELEMQELVQRLEKLHAPLQQRIAAYEQRIEELERELAAKGEENRELIGTRINVTRQRLQIERERRRFGTN